MLNSIKEVELEYTKEFANSMETDHYIIFSDDRLPDMNHHNFVYVKEDIPEQQLQHLIQSEIDRRLASKEKDALFVSDFEIDKEYFEHLLFEVTHYAFDYMMGNTDIIPLLKDKEDFIVKSTLEKGVLEDGIEIDIIANMGAMGDFAIKRIHRKAEVYSNPQLDTQLYVGYYKGLAIGNCELFIDKGIAKLEDFDIIEAYQRKGFGTAFLKYLLTTIDAQQIPYMYLVTDSTDTAKDMYSKCHFKKIGSKYEVYIDFEKKHAPR